MHSLPEVNQKITPFPEFLGKFVVGPFQFVTARDFCNEYVRRHFAERQYAKDEDPERTAAFLAVSRYEFLLQEARKMLAEKMSCDEIFSLVSVFLGDFHAPWTAIDIPGEFMDDHGWESFEEIPLEARPFVKMLEGLSHLERIALADLLERIWHVFMSKGSITKEDYMQAVGLKFKS